MPSQLVFKGDKPKKHKHSHSSKKRKLSPSASLPTATDSHPVPVEDDDSWTSPDAPTDITGPTILVLPTAPPSTLAHDPHFTVHPSRLENLVDENPSTAEPHLISQVWVANRVAGTDTLSFKASNGRYLACDKLGLVTASREAVGPEEQWSVLPVEDGGAGKGVFRLKGYRGGYLGISGMKREDDEREQKVESLRVRGDEEEETESTKIRIRMQARFKPQVKVQKAEKAREKISRRQLEEEVGRKLEDDEVRSLKKARKEGSYHEALLDVKVKGKHDKFA